MSKNEHSKNDVKNMKNLKKKIFRLSLYAGEIMLKNGAEIYRVEDTILRICRSRNIKHVNAFVTPTGIFISDYRFDGITFIKRIKSRDINLTKISDVNNFSRDFVNSDMSSGEALKILKNIDTSNTYNKYFQILFSGLASACFAMLFGGGLMDFIGAFIISMIALIVNQKIQELSDTPYIAIICAGITIGLLSVCFPFISRTFNIDKIVVGSIMPLLPGVSFTNGLRDFISGDLLSGLGKVCEAVLIALYIAIGVGVVLKIWVDMFGGVL